jgi:transcriptional regulator with XRE-family HTH domain
MRMAVNPSPTVRRRELGATLRRYRLDAGLSVKDVAERLLCSQAKISRIETGHRNPTLRDVRDLSDIYGIRDSPTRDRLMILAQESRQRGWWQSYNLDPAIETLVGLEGAAVAIYEYQTSGIPAWLQTPQYAEAILSAWHPEYSSEKLRLAVDARLARQRNLASDGLPQFRAIVDEGSLHRAVGGPAVMRSQLLHIVETSQSRNISIQVIPFAAGAHQGMASSFVLLDFPGDAVPSIVHVEGMVGNLYLEQAADVARYREVFSRLERMALGLAASLDLIRKVSCTMAG